MRPVARIHQRLILQANTLNCVNLVGGKGTQRQVLDAGRQFGLACGTGQCAMRNGTVTDVAIGEFR